MLLLLACSVRLHIVNTESTGHFFPVEHRKHKD